MKMDREKKIQEDMRGTPEVRVPGVQIPEARIPELIGATRGSFDGEVNLQWDAVKGARRYVVQEKVGERGHWKHYDIITEPYCMLSGLKPGKEYFFRVASVTMEGQGEWSKPVRKKT